MYNEYQPSLLLAPYIDKYWEFKGNPDYGMKINILPDGCTDFIFTLGEVADIAEQESLIMQPYRSYFVGPMSRYSTLITYAKSIHMFGIRFLPCGLFRFMQLPLEELGNQRISTFESGGIFNDSLAERLCEQPYIQDKIRLIESFLTQALCTNNKIEKQISYAVDCINLSKGQLPIRSLVENVCLCQRHFERKFKHQTGYSPKEYSRIIKFKNAVDLLRSTSSNQLFSVAIEAGYYDTAHLSKEIRQYTRFLFILTGYGRNHINISETIKVVFLQRSHPGVSYFCTVSNTKKKQWNHLKKKQKLCFNNVK